MRWHHSVMLPLRARPVKPQHDFYAVGSYRPRPKKPTARKPRRNSHFPYSHFPGYNALSMAPNPNALAAEQIANAALSKIQDFYFNHVHSPKERPPSGALYHYTTAEGLKGIIEDNELWATSAYLLNDSGEVTYGCDVLSEALTKYIAQKHCTDSSVTRGVVESLRNWFREVLPVRKDIQPIYVVCFCEDDNLLSQWRAYGEAGGYSIGFAPPAEDLLSNQGFKPEPNIYTSKWVKVEYDRNEQFRKLASLLNPIVAIFEDQATAEAIRSVRDSLSFTYQQFLSAITDILFEEALAFKNEAFKVEKEWRVVVRQRLLIRQATDDGGRTGIPTYFRPSKGRIVPYIKLIPVHTDKKLPIVAIRSGPTLDQATASMAISMMLQTNGFAGVRVKGSDIPVKY